MAKIIFDPSHTCFDEMEELDPHGLRLIPIGTIIQCSCGLFYEFTKGPDKPARFKPDKYWDCIPGHYVQKKIGDDRWTKKTSNGKED